MKINPLLIHFLCLKNIQKAFRIMKISFFIMFVCVCQLFAVNTEAQNAIIQLKSNKLSIEELFKEIENQTDYLVVYSTSGIRSNVDLSLSKKKAKVSEYLEEALRGHSLKYEFVNNYIILSSSESNVSQQDGKQLRGTVFDQNGEPVIGANVVEQGTQNGTITDINGQFILTVGNKSALEVSYIGYLTQVVTPTNDNVIVRLKEDTQNLEEVVVIGYGTAKKRDLTGAISSVKTEKLEMEAPRSVQDLLRANSAGLSIAMSTTPKGDADLQVRGKGTLKAGSAPLLVLDGVIYEGALEDINPNDISSVDVLKDASSSAVYGAKAANGVVVITTKKGKTGKPVVTFNTNVGFSQVANQRKVLDGAGFLSMRQDYEIGRNTDEYLSKYPQMFINPNQLNGVSQLDWYNYDQKVPATEVTNDQLMRSWLNRLELKVPEIDNYMAGIETDWADMMFQTGLQQDYTASISNRKEDMSYYWSVGYADREGFVSGERFTTFRTRLNLESKITDFLTIGLNSNFATRDESFLPCDTTQLTKVTPYCSDNRNDPNSKYQRLPSGETMVINPFYDNQYRDRKDLTHTLNANIYAQIHLPFGFEYQMNFVPNYQWREYYNHESSENEEWANKGGASERKNIKKFSWQIDNILRWKKEFNKIHNIEVTLLANAEKGQTWETVAKASGYTPSDILGYHRLQAGGVPLVSSNDTYRTGDALMARAFYSYKNKYMITTSIRRDGYSAFGQRNPRATFPAVALGWVFTSENFLEKTADWLNYGKLRFSWGENGNRDIGQYEALASLNSNKYAYIDANGNIYLTSHLFVEKMANMNLKWERSSSYNVGLDFSLFNDILSGSLEGYFATTNDLLVDRSLPEIIGFTKVASNLGQLQNRGFEMTLNANIINRNNFAWSASGNFSLNRRKIKSLYGDMVDIVDDNGNVIGQKEADDSKNGWFIGEDPDRIWDYERDGVWQLGEEEEAAKYGNQPGDFKYVDQDGDGVMTDKDKVLQHYKTPRFRWTLRNEFTFYKDLSLSFTLYSNWGQYKTFNGAANAGFAERYSAYDQPRWTAENPINDFARIGSKNIGNNYVNQSFIRLDNVTVSYNVPKDFLKKFKVQNMRFSLSVRNAAVFAPKWKYWDPETGTMTPRNFNLGVNFTL